MLPSELKATDLTPYPPQGRALATQNLALLQQLPFPYLIVLLRELIAFDWKLPAERRRLTGQIAWLSQAAPAQRATLLQGFASLHVDDTLLRTPWPASPAATLEQLTAFLWSSHQMDAFRQHADDFASAMALAVPSPQPQQPRLGIVIVGAGVPPNPAPTPDHIQPQPQLFRKLRPHGVYFTQVQPEHGFELLLAEAQRRAAKSSATSNPTSNPVSDLTSNQIQSAAPAPTPSDEFLHWYIDGGAARPTPNLTQISYAALQPARQTLLERTQQAIESGSMGPERLRTLLAQLRPQDIGLTSAAPGGSSTDILNHFQLSLLTEGSGTQIFSTTFVQWAARECLRRAEPETLLLRYAPRQQQQPMNVMLSGTTESAPDPEGSLIDADMGAYYTWLNLRRLTGASQLRFLVWFEGHNQALAIGPGLPAGTTSDSPMTMLQILKLLA